VADQGGFFSRLLSEAAGGKELPEQLDKTAIQFVNLLGILRSGEALSLQGTEGAKLNFENILLQAEITRADFLEAIESVMEGIVQEVPLMKEVFPKLEEESMEEVLAQLLEMISLMSPDTLKKLDPSSLELLIKTSKAVEQSFRQNDLSFHQTELAESLQQNLKMIAQKIEQLLTGESLKNGKWNQILEDVFHKNVGPKGSIFQAKNSFLNPVLINKTPGEQVLNNSIPVSKHQLANHLNYVVPTGEEGVKTEGEQVVKPNAATTIAGILGQPQMTRTEQFSLFVNKSQTGTNYDQFVKEFANIMGKSQMVQAPNMSKLLIKLYPEQLGSLRIELLQQNGIMTAKILASTKAAKEMLDSQLTNLRQALSSQNLQVEKIEVAQTYTESQRQERQQSQQQHGQQPKEQTNQQSNDHEETDESTFKELLMNSEI
jgi:flagellar hook-length control protein FliK